MMRLILLIPTLALAALIAHAVRAGNFSPDGWLVTDPWGWVTLFDLYFGFALSGIVIAGMERKFWPSVFWITPILILGNVWTGLWFILRGPALWRRLVRVETMRAAPHFPADRIARQILAKFGKC